MICVCPRVKSAEPCVRGETPTSHVDRADLVGAAAVRAPLLDRDLLADEVLVDRLGGPLDELLRQRVLDRRPRPRPAAAPTGNGSSTVSMIRSKSRLPLGRLELLRVLLGVGQRAQLGLELLADRALDGLEPERLEQRVQALAHLHLAGDVLLGRVHRQLGAQLGEDLLDRGRRLAEAVLGRIALADPVAVRAP